jgi:hypothetical protein
MNVTNPSFAIRTILRLVAVTVASLMILGSDAAAQGAPAWRTWTSIEGVEIEAYLKEVREGQVVIVRRDGQEFVAPIERFSAADREFVAQQVQRNLPSAQDFRAMDFSSVDIPDQSQIEEVPHVRQRGQDPLGTAALQMVLDFHNASRGQNLAELLGTIEVRRGDLLAANDIRTALRNFPVELEVLRPRPPRGGAPVLNPQEWALRVNAIRTAIHWGLPVVIAYRTLPELDTPAVMGVAVGYDRRRLQLLDPAGGRSPSPLDIRDLEERFEYAIVLFPRPEAVAGIPQEQHQASREFLSQISSGIRQVPEFTSSALATFLNEKGIRASNRDVNRDDLRSTLGQTRSFARSGGLSFIDAALDSGKIVVTPQEYESAGNNGFILIYGKADNNQYHAVEFFPDRQFQRGAVDRAEVARRWLTRDDRTYRLDLIEITVPAQPTTAANPRATRSANGQRPPRQAENTR